MSDSIIHASLDSPPPFHWDAWYAQIGGRKIKIEEVDAILKQIYNEQYMRFEGPVHDQKIDFDSPSNAANHIKAKAKEFGADIVGICRIEPSDIYK